MVENKPPSNLSPLHTVKEKTNYHLERISDSSFPLLRMSMLCKLVDAVLFVWFVFIALAAPFLDAQVCFPHHFFPSFLVELKNWYTQGCGDYLLTENPHFIVGLVWLELIFQWPLALACVYGIIAAKSWWPTTCLMYGSSTLTTMVAALAELILSKRASDKLMTVYFLALGFVILALLRGLFGDSGKSVTIAKQAVLRKKRA